MLFFNIGDNTVTLHLYSLLFTFAVIIAEPGLTPVIIPSDDTFTIDFLPDYHFILSFVPFSFN